MMPHEVQAIMAKILFFIFATCVLCLSRARAFDSSLDYSQLKSPIVTSSALILK